jgi:hypothetical protein
MRLRCGPGALGFVLGALMAGLAVASVEANAGWDRVVGQSAISAPMPGAPLAFAAPALERRR